MSKFSFILTTNIFIEKIYSQKLERDFINVISVAKIETMYKYRKTIQIILRSMEIHFILCYFLLNKNFNYSVEIWFYSNNEYFYREELQSKARKGF